MSDINWQQNAICYANGKQWFDYQGDTLIDNRKTSVGAYTELFGNIINIRDFQLNEIVTGDFIPASELDTEQKYNEVVEVFGLFGHESDSQSGYEGLLRGKFTSLTIRKTGFSNVKLNFDCKRQLTYSQIIAIGKLKRMMLEREKSAPKTAQDLIPDFTKASTNKYEREITDRQGNSATVDVYDVLKAFEVTCPATQHAVKKLLCSGLRGHKDLQTDLIEAK